MRFLNAENELVAELTTASGSQRQALTLVGLSRSTWHYRHHPRARVAEPIPQADRAYPSRIGPADRAAVEARITAGWEQGVSVDHAFATAWDDAVMLASRRSWWRIAARIADQSTRPVVPTRRENANRTPREAPVLEATEPGQVWSWDITDLRTPWRGVAFKAYAVMDIYSRKVVGHRVEEREVDQLAVDMFTDAFGVHGIPDAVHADSGPAMRSTLLKDLLGDLGVTQTHNRPRVSNDNPFSEAWFKTAKYWPGYPGHFDTLAHARAWADTLVRVYNTQHRHSGLEGHTPASVHDGTWIDIHHTRQATLDTLYAANPGRYAHPPKVKTPPGLVALNPTKTEHRLQTG